MVAWMPSFMVDGSWNQKVKPRQSDDHRLHHWRQTGTTPNFIIPTDTNANYLLLDHFSWGDRWMQSKLVIHAIIRQTTTSQLIHLTIKHGISVIWLPKTFQEAIHCYTDSKQHLCTWLSLQMLINYGVTQQLNEKKKKAAMSIEHLNCTIQQTIHYDFCWFRCHWEIISCRMLRFTKGINPSKVEFQIWLGLGSFWKSRSDLFLLFH